MNKIIYLIIVCLLCIPLAMATRVSEVKVYADDERISSADETGGDLVVNVGDTVDFLVDIENTLNVSFEAKIKGTMYDIDDGSDIVKEQAWFTIEKGDTRTKGVFFQIPLDASVNDYDMKLVIYYRYANSTEDSETIDYDMTVRKSTTTSTELDLKNALTNLSINCEGITKGLSTCFGYMGRYSNCTEELSTVKEQRGDYENDAANNKLLLDECNSVKQSCENEKATLLSSANSKYSVDECQAKINEQLQKTNQQNTNNMLLFGAIGVVGFIVWQKRKQNATVPDAFSRDRGF